MRVPERSSRPGVVIGLRKVEGMDDQEGPEGVGMELEWGGKGWEGGSVNRVGFR